MNLSHRLIVAMAVVFGLAACAAPEFQDDEKRSATSKLSSRWEPPASDATGTYEGLGGEGCAGGLKPGTKALGEQVKAQFGVSYGGYSCRANTANTKELSIHAVGRALDVMVGQGSSKGDEVANYFVENATILGIDLIIWNHTLWKVTPTGATSRQYTGPNPHTDHVHAEVTHAVAESGPGEVTDDAEQPTDDDTLPEDEASTDPTSTDDPYADDTYDDYDNYDGYDDYDDYNDYDDDMDDDFICDDEGYCY